MLSRLLAARVTRPLTSAHCRRALSRAASQIADGHDEGISAPLLAKIVEKRLRTVRSSLNVDHQEPPSSVEIAKWKHVIEAEDIDGAFRNCQDLHEAPDWVVLYLLSSKVNSPVQAMAATTLMLRHFPKADVSIQPSLLILTARFLAKHQTTLPMTNLVKGFLMLDLARPSTQLNLLLRSMSHFRPTPEIAKATTKILAAMRARQVRLHSRTYRSLLSNKLVTLELAKMLQRRMDREGFAPNATHLEAYLRIFAKHGAVHASARYLNLIRRLRLQEGKDAPHGVHLSSGGAQVRTSEGNSNTRWNTEFMSSFGRHTGSAFHYLRGLAGDGAVPESRPQSMRKESRVPHANRKIGPAIWKKGLHVSDWSVVLNTAARDPKMSSEQFLDMFGRVRATANFPLTVGMFTVLMRGLVKKGDYSSAYEVWERCCRTWHRRRAVDAKALTVAMEVLVGSGRALTAFDTLVETTGILRTDAGEIPRGRARPGGRAGRKLYSRVAKVDAVLVNALMNAYLKYGRPDIVFKLWDAYTPLFGVAPNAETLTVLLKAAREAARFDHTFRGLMEHMGLHSIFSRKNVWPDYREKSKPQIAQSLRGIIAKGQAKSGDTSGTETYVRKSLWNGELAAPRVVILFKEIVLGNFVKLRSVKPPATAVWPDEAQAGHPVRDALRTLGFGRRNDQDSEAEMKTGDNRVPFLVGPSLAKATISPTPSPAPPGLSSSEHPQIVPNEKTFAAYIALLSAQGRASEVALTLAWMRALGVIPTRRPLALALVLWSEASVRGPLLERYGGIGEYERLYSWLVKWLGQERMPTDAAMAWAFERLRKEREK